MSGVLGVAAGFWACGATPAVAVQAHLIGRDIVGAAHPYNVGYFEGPGCGSEGAVTLQLPPGARQIALDPLDQPIGTDLPGPDGFIGKNSTGDQHYATLDGFTIAPGQPPNGPQVVFTAHASPAWCSGYTGTQATGPTPASQQTDPQADPSYHAGWRTASVSPIVDYVLDLHGIFTVDPQGHTRSRPPRSMAVSRRHSLTAIGIRWGRWGAYTVSGSGVIRYAGRRVRANLQLLNLELGGDPEGLAYCPVGRAYYQDLYVSVPAWREKTTYGVNATCQFAVSNNSAGDLRPRGR